MDQMGVTQEQIDSDNTNIVPDRADPPGVIAQCEEQLANGGVDPNDALTCQVILAKASGELEPGEYPTGQLLDELERAGFGVSGVDP